MSHLKSANILLKLEDSSNLKLNAKRQISKFDKIFEPKTYPYYQMEGQYTDIDARTEKVYCLKL